MRQWVSNAYSIIILAYNYGCEVIIVECPGATVAFWGPRVPRILTVD